MDTMYRIKIIGTDQTTAMMRKDEVRKTGEALKNVYVAETLFVVQRQNSDGSWNDWRLLEDF